MSLPGSGWADPCSFERAFRRRMNLFIRQHRRTAREYEFRRTKHGRQLVTAAYRYYGGYQSSCERFGYGRPYVRPIRQLRNEPARRPVYAYWTQREWQLQILQANFRSSLEWGIMPRVSDVKQDFCRLASHWLGQPGGWGRAARELNLLPYMTGQRLRYRIMAFFEALDFYERHGRYPYASESSGRLRHRRFSTKMSWANFMAQDNFHPRMLYQLLARWKRHYRWCGQRQPDRQSYAHQRINALMIRQRMLEPFGRSSP